jgi:cell wall-associated NlpC family hydrolase
MSTTIRVSIARTMSVAIVLVGLLAGCSTKEERTTMYADELQSLKEKYAPDRRLAVFDVTVVSEGLSVVARGEVDDPDAKREVLEMIREGSGKEAVDSIVVLPDTALGARNVGIVTVSVGNARREPEHSAELVTQFLMGMTVKILKRHGGWLYIQGPDRYLGWIDDDAIAVTDAGGFEEWVAAPKVIVTDYFGVVREKAQRGAQPVTDVVTGNLLRRLGVGGAWTEVALPDGRKGFVESTLTSEYRKWKEKTHATPEGVERAAKLFLGVPYLWGGTSAKGFDCSGYTKTVYLLNDVDLDRDADEQARQGDAVSPGDDFKNLRKGDLLFFGRKPRGERPERITHVGIYLGDREFIHCSGMVRMNSLDPNAPDFDSGRLNSFVRARRIIGASQVKEIR